MTPFDLMVATLLGEPLPPLPALPGRRHYLHDEPATEAELAFAVSDGCTPFELAAMAGITRHAAFERLRASHSQQGDQP